MTDLKHMILCKKYRIGLARKLYGGWCVCEGDVCNYEKETGKAPVANPSGTKTNGDVGETELEKENRLMNATIASSAVEIFELQKRLAATIERCAKVALAFKVNTDDPRTAQEQLAATIRALKDKP